MGVPLSQMWSVASYVLKQKLRGRKRYPLVLMLEPLFRCNLACGGCGKIQFPAAILKRQVSVEDCLKAVDECGAPVVSIPGGEPLLHPQIEQIVEGITARGKYVYLCTNAILLEKHLSRFKPSKYLSFSVHLDGPRADHDAAVCREGVYDVAIAAIRTAIQKGFRVTTNTTVFNNTQPEHLHELFDTLMQMGVEGMMISPGYQYEKAPDQEHFLNRHQTVQLFRRVLGKQKRSWKFNQSPLFIEFLKGNWQLECTPWGNPTYNLFGWQKPCYLLQEGYASSFDELMNTTDWEAYGRSSGNAKCQDCMVHCGYEPSAVDMTFGSLKGLAMSAWRTIAGPSRHRESADLPLPSPVPAPHFVTLETSLRSERVPALSECVEVS
ncbi:adenosyl-hopene transferase HpnH [Planctomicrobium sp. SH664]|uniref:adenosyl-hopene transferase HpnH n=1 Tax=Planctomicrobium sp. SH664 TaxID=3448125 RepID=UPI003F5C4B8D